MIPDSDGKISDADLVAEFRLMVTELDTATDSLDRYTLTEGIEVLSDDAFAAAMRAIDALMAERDAARAEVERLRAVLGGVPEVLESYAESVQPHLDNTPNPTAGLALAVIRAKAAVIRAALESEAADDIR